jgi:alpha-ketoglutarate-dependent taurine dioxygenase
MQEEMPPKLDITSIKRRQIKSSNDFISIGLLYREEAPPILVECLLDSLSLPTWAESNISLIEDLLQKHGGILFRGFANEGASGLHKFTKAIRMEMMNYMEGATPRTALGNNVYTSTEFPPDQTIALHNENSYVMTWPMKICFSCVLAPLDGGESPIADVRKVRQHINDSIRKRFEEKGYMLVRNFSEHLSLPWGVSFKVTTKEELATYCKKAHIEMRWMTNDHLRTWQVRPAMAAHPRTNEWVWFNHIAFWHVSSLEKNVREILLDTYSEEGLPYNTYYGDGTRIEDDVVEELRQAFNAETVKFPWRKGDLLLLDNMLVAHGRAPYNGPREIIVSMGEPHTRTDI